MTVYLIDHKLERRKALATSERRRDEQTFIANGGRYVQVEDESEWGYPDHWRHVRGRKVFAFVKDIQRWIEENFEDRLEDGELFARLVILGWKPE